MDLYKFSLRLTPYRRSILAAGFLLSFAAAAACLVASASMIMQSRIASHAAAQADSLTRTTSKWLETFALLDGLSGVTPCSDYFLDQMRRIAFLPDGIHELIHMKGNAIQCSVTQGKLAEPLDIGEPDFAVASGSIDIWFDRDLSILGFPGLSGTFMRVGDSMTIISEPALSAAPGSWLDQRIAFMTDAVARGEKSAPAEQMSFRREICDANGIYCAEFDAPVGALMKEATSAIAGGLLLCIVSGLAGMLWLRNWLNHIWSFPTRFRHLLDADTLFCQYQPLLDLEERRVGGIEVLARWRDICGETVYPDKFLPVVERNAMTRLFTEVLVDRVYRDLLALPDQGDKLRVHFNIFPQDFDASWLLEIFAPLSRLSDRFIIVAELVESDSLPLEHTREVVETLRQENILTYIDDFGAGYSNIQYLGYLSVAGVKLDRSFGQAPEGSLMAGLLHSAAGMINGAGFALVVEGVETEARLADLEKSGVVQQVQGYYIARPLPFRGLVEFLEKERLEPSFTADRKLAIVG